MDINEFFVRGVWSCIPDQNDCSWIERMAAQKGTDKPLGDFGPIVREMIEKGVSPKTIARFAKIIGYETAFSVCYHLGDPNASYESYPNAEEGICWSLFRVNSETGEPIEPICGVHELILSLDPDGREMRPEIL
jgi:hypothetical protein